MARSAGFMEMSSRTGRSSLFHLIADRSSFVEVSKTSISPGEQIQGLTLTVPNRPAIQDAVQRFCARALEQEVKAWPYLSHICISSPISKGCQAW